MDLTINVVIDSLVELGLLVPLSGDIGYNGLTTPQGISNEYLSEHIEDGLVKAMSEYAEHFAGLEGLDDLGKI